MGARTRSALGLLCAFACVACTFLWATQPLQFSGISPKPRNLFRMRRANQAGTPIPEEVKKSQTRAGVVPLSAYDNLFDRSKVFFLDKPAVRFESASVTFIVDEATYSQALEAHEEAGSVRIRKRDKESLPQFHYRLGKRTATNTITHMQRADRPKCDVSIDKPVFIVPLIGITFGENFYRTVMQAYIAARAIEKELGTSPEQLEVVFQDPQRENIVTGLRSITALQSSGNICFDDVRGDYANASYTVALQKPSSNYTYYPKDMKLQCDKLLPDMPFQQHVGLDAQKFNNEVYAYLELLNLGTLKAAHAYHGQTICPTKTFLLAADYLQQWQSGQQEILHSPGMTEMVRTVQQNAGLLTVPSSPMEVLNGSYRAAVVGRADHREAPLYTLLRAKRPTIVLAARSCFPMLKPEVNGVCCNCKRVLLNDQDLLREIRDRFTPRGYTVRYVEMSTLTALETVQLMAETTILISTHSSALWNAVFMPANAAVIELYPLWYYEAMFQNFVRMTGKFYFKTRLPKQTINSHDGHYLADIGDVLRLVTLAHDVITNTEMLRSYATRNSGEGKSGYDDDGDR